MHNSTLKSSGVVSFFLLVYALQAMESSSYSSNDGAGPQLNVENFLFRVIPADGDTTSPLYLPTRMVFRSKTLREDYFLQESYNENVPLQLPYTRASFEYVIRFLNESGNIRILNQSTPKVSKMTTQGKKPRTTLSQDLRLLLDYLRLEPEVNIQPSSNQTIESLLAQFNHFISPSPVEPQKTLEPQD
jgi:hypothetical protein